MTPILVANTFSLTHLYVFAINGPGIEEKLRRGRLVPLSNECADYKGGILAKKFFRMNFEKCPNEAAIV